MSINIITPQEMLKSIADKVKAKRLAFNLSQRTLSEKAGVSYGVLKKFERTGQIALLSLLKIALVLDALSDFQQLFMPNKPESALSLDLLMKENKKRKRGRQ